MAVGKISGRLLKDNLLRDNVDLAFETDLLYLDVNNRRIGVNTTSPSHDLQVVGTTRVTDLDVTNSVEIGDIVINGTYIYSKTNTLNLTPVSGSQVVYNTKLKVDDIQIEGNLIQTTESNSDLEFSPNGTGRVKINSDTIVYGDLHATGTITADGNIQLGDANTDNIVFNADVASNIVPDLDNTYALGTASKRWADLWVGTVNTDAVSAGEITVDGIDIGLRQGNIYYVAANGDDGNSGTHQNDPLSSVGRALDLAGDGDTIFIYPGVYQETLPLIVPKGVTVKGSGIRSVTIEPDSDVTVDMFLLNGESTIEDLTIRGFEYDSGTNTGYAFRFAPNFKVTTRSPYIRNITVITAGSSVRLATNPADDPRGFLDGDAGKGAYLDGSVADPTSVEASMLFHSVTFITPGVDCITMTNGVRVEWLNSFTYFADRSLYAVSGSAGFANDGKTRIKISNTTGTFNVGNTLSYYDTDGVTLLASGTIESIAGDFYIIDGKVSGFETPSDRASKTIFVNGDAESDTAIKQFGLSSLKLDGTGDYINLASQPDFDFNTGDFTIEAWVYRGGIGVQEYIIDLRTAATQYAPTLYIDASDNLQYYVNGSDRISSTGGLLTASTWHHIAVARSGTDTKLYINGNQVGSTWTDSSNYIQGPVVIGARYDGSSGLTGWIDEVRISKDLARYTGATYTIPTTAFSGDNNTVLLSHFDAPDGSTTFLDDGVTLQDIRTSSGGTASVIDFADYSDFGAEIRSIASAAVYGNYGAYGDGLGVIGYLIGTNFAYIGSGRFSDNDPTNVNQPNEVVETNNAKIYYTSVDNKGDFRVGDYFFIDQRNGTITFNSQSFTISSSSGITFTDGVNTTIVDPTQVYTGNIRISGNTIESLTGGITLTAANNDINFTSNVDITGNLDITNDFSISGNITIGTSLSDDIIINASVASDLSPSTNTLYDLGTVTNQWRNLYVGRAYIDDIEIDGNLIRTTVSNSDLELRANGSGEIVVPENDVTVENNFTVLGNTTLEDVAINGDITQTGNINQTGNTTVVGDVGTTTLTVSSTAQFEDIKIDNNEITTTQTDSNLTLKANGTGIINIPDNNVQINQDLTVLGILTFGNLTTPGIVTADQFNTGTITIDDNYIATTVSNANLELRANGSGVVYLPDSNLLVDEDLTVNGTTYLKNTEIDGTLTHTGITNQTGDYSITGSLDVTGNTTVSGYAQFDEIKIDTNFITTTTSNTDLELRADGTGKVLIPSNDVEILQDLFVQGDTYLTNVTLNSTAQADKFTTGDILIDDNYIATTQSNSNLELRANGSGSIVFEDLSINQNVISSLGVDQDIEFTPSGTGNVKINSNQSLKVPVGTTAQRPASPEAGMMRFNTDYNQYEGFNGSYWIQLGGVIDVDRNTYIIPEVTPGSNENTLYFYTDGFLAATLNSTQFNVNSLKVDDIEINGNIIRTTVSNSNLELNPNGTGGVVIDNFKISTNTITNTVSGSVTEFRSTGNGYYSIQGTGAVVIPVGDSLTRPTPPTTGMLRFNTDLQYTEIYDGTTWTTVAGTGGALTAAQAEDIALATVLTFG